MNCNQKYLSKNIYCSIEFCSWYLSSHPRKATVFVTLSLVLILLVGQNNVFKIPIITGAKAIRHKTSSQAPSSNEGNSLQSSSSIPSNTASPVGCINYNSSTRTITVGCSSARLTDINNKLHDSSILSKQSPNGIWFLSANLLIAKGAVFHIDPTDTKWLKINSKVIGSVAKTSSAYYIDIHGSMIIDSVKITSWDPTTNYYAITNGSRTGIGQFILGAPRPGIIIEKDATGPTNIMNSEIAYLGYEGGKHLGASGFAYSGGEGSILKNDNIHHVYFGFYSIGVGHMIIENNIIRNSGHYGLDPHTGTHDMIIRNNTIYDNNGSGIICSLNCYNILIEKNKVHDNAENGIDFSRNMTNSIARNNIVYNEPSGIFVSQSHNDQIYNNTISNNRAGINVNSGSSNNKLYDNTIMNSKSRAILINNGSSGNTFTANKIVSSTPEGLKIVQDSTSKNIFSNNQIVAPGETSTKEAEPASNGNTVKHAPNKKTSTE
jgi:mannuronan 5-epimerase